MKKISWHGHAKQRILERSIDPKIVLLAIKEPEQVFTKNKFKVLHRRYYETAHRKHYLLRIFIEENPHEIVIYSVYKTSKINKYWRGQL